MSRNWTPPAHLTEPHYYRLGYQLAAQYANWLLEPEPSDISDHPQIPGLDQASRALEVAHQVSSEARDIIDWYQARDVYHRWWNPLGPRSLLPKETRLLRFLVGTVEPSAELVSAGLHVAIFRDPEVAEAHAVPLRVRARDPNDLSYRALYNLACYETARAASDFEWADDPFAAALQDLAWAFVRTDGRPRKEIARWALSDPALMPLREAEPFAFAELIALYGRIGDAE